MFLVSILSIYFLGLSMGGGRVVYAKWDVVEKRLPLICQLGVGLPTLPALGQAMLVRQGANPVTIGGVPFMAPPLTNDEMADLHRRFGYLFEMGTLYTMIAGLLNVLAIYDAGAGPVWMVPESVKKRRAKKEKQGQKPGSTEGENTSPQTDKAAQG